MCSSPIPCPLCAQPHFGNLESLRIGLIKVATENLTCPVCKGVFIGLDKLTIHLFSHCENILTAVKTTEANGDVRSARLEPDPKKKKEDKVEEVTPPNMPVFNMNALPFIGVPDNVSKPPECASMNQNNSLSERCDICGFYFLGKNILHVHKKLIHNLQETEVAKKHACHLCPKVFKMRGSLMVHQRMVHSSHQKARTKPENDAIKETEAKSPEGCSDVKTERVKDSEPGNNKQWRCDICQKFFTTKYFLKKHNRLHTGEMPYSCSQCNKTFTFQQSYHKHLLYHNDDKPHQCTLCGRSFKELSTLHNHQRIHTGEKPFSCESCGKCFRQRVSYLVHRRIHTGVMPYKCTACDKSFRYKVSQRTHKCIVQPPGLLIRQSGELVQKLIKNQNEIINNNTDFKPAHENPADQTKRDEADEKSIIDELINDSIKKIDFGESNLFDIINKEDHNLPSPSDKFKTLTLSPPSCSPVQMAVENYSNIRHDMLKNEFAQPHCTYHDNMIFDQIYK